MKIEYFHASKYGNGVKVAEEFKRIASAAGAEVNVHHVKDVRPEDAPQADLYVFSSPGRIGKPIGSARKFLKGLRLPPGAKYALLTTEMAPQPDKKTGQLPAEGESKWQKVRPVMDEILQDKGLKKVADGTVYLLGIQGPLEEGWEKKVGEFAAKIVSPQP